MRWSGNGPSITLVVLFANSHMGTVEERVVSNIDVPPIYCQYVDDTFIRVNAEEDLRVLRNAFITNSSLNFTYERSEGGEFPSLDIKVQQIRDCFNTQVHVKPTNLDQCFNGSSECFEK